MIFSELYGAYYNTVAAVISEAITKPVSDADIRNIIERYAFSESICAIPDAIKDERWQLIKKDGTTPIENKPSMPLTNLQKSWLKAVACDPRIKLFGDINFDFPEVEPLFLPTDYIVFDKYGDGDDFSDENYISNFRIILDAIKNKYSLEIEMINKLGYLMKRTIFPRCLEYSEKDDKIRLIGMGNKYSNTINLMKIKSCKKSDKEYVFNDEKSYLQFHRSVKFELTDQRNALERALLHFAHFEKTAERLDDDKYLVTVHYNKEDETEIVIRILSFGPMIKVVAPLHFISLIKRRLIAQKSCE